MTGPDSDDVLLLKGCYLEAHRCDDIALKLEGLRIALNEPAHSHLALTINKITEISQRLRELADIAQVNRDHLVYVLDPLNIVLPCLCRTLRDIKTYYDDRTRSKEDRWRCMYHCMNDEVGQPLLSRFEIYHRYISGLRDILFRTPQLDPTAMERLKRSIFRLREARGIGAPSAVQPGPLVRHVGYQYPLDPISHWAEYVFPPVLPSLTSLGPVGQTESLGPHHELGYYKTPMNSKILFRQSFDSDNVSLTVFSNSENGCAYLLLRIFKDDLPWFSQRGAHELCIKRHGSSLQLRRWSMKAGRSKAWATLYFGTWEELVLMYCSFISLKARNHLTVRCGPKELDLGGEEKLFQARTIEDGRNHSLIVYRDHATGGFRLHTAVWAGDLRECPVWTAFVTHQIGQPNWYQRVSRHRVRLANLRLFVFCKDYREHNQRKGPSGAFEIKFVSDEAAPYFKDLFYPPPMPG